MTPEAKADAEIGKSAAEELEKRYQGKIAKEPPELPSLMGIVERLRPTTQKPQQTYQVKVIAIKAINAFSLPGGYIYFTQGLLDGAESDDELAAVAAHEMAHIVLNHSRTMMKRSDRYTKVLGAAVLASVLTRSERVDAGAVAMVGTMVLEDAMNGYGREAESEADRQAVRYLQATKVYHPVAMLTVVEGLARIEAGEAPVELGVMQTHPGAKDRVDAVLKELNALKIPIERRRVTKSLVASAVPVTSGGQEIGEIRLNQRIVFQPAAAVDGASPVARAQQSADLLNALLRANLELSEVDLKQSEGRSVIEARGQAVITIAPEDAAFHKSTVEALAQQAMSVLRVGFQQEKVRRAY